MTKSGSDSSKHQRRDSAPSFIAQTVASEALIKAGQFDFDAHSFAQEEVAQGAQISLVFTHLARKHQVISNLKREGGISNETVFGQTLLSFLGKVDMLYRADAIYHSATHAADVLSTVDWFLQSPTLRKITSEVDVFMGLLAAAIHDVGHGGVNNMFLQKTMDPIAITYNDRSCLEQMHLAIAFELTQTDPACNWLGELEIKKQQYIRKGIIGMVLATDMAKHAEYVRQLAEMALDQANCGEEDKNFVLQCVLHAADTSNPAKPRDSMLRWTKLINLEFWKQGDEERRLGLEISPLCDREQGKKGLPQGQIGFINYVVLPMFTSMLKVVLDCDEAARGLEATKAFWQEMNDQGKTFDDIYPDDEDDQGPISKDEEVSVSAKK
jgi:hypothetical protein